MATYDEVLMQEQLLQMDDAIKQFLDSYGAHRGTPGQRTFIFFPGGMGSELVRAKQAYDPGRLSGTYGQYETVWVDLEKVLLEGWALQLQMNANRDTNDCFMVAHGPLDNCALHPYNDLPNWCAANNLDLLMVGWDFRRDAGWNVDFFLNHLVPAVRLRAQANDWPEDIFRGATVVGHSFGGMVVKWILNQHDHAFCQNLRLAITVGTPFYGSSGQTQALFTSMRELGPFYDLDRVTLTISTLPGGYSLFFLDHQTYETYKDLLSLDPQFPLHAYPSVDATDGTPVDPYVLAQNPANENQWRYPIINPNRAFDWTWFAGYLNNGLLDYQAVSAPLDASVRDRFYNIRGVQTAGGEDTPQTDVRQSWAWYDVTRSRQPQASTIIQPSKGAGDGVIPAFSARLVTQPPDNIHTIRGDKIGHDGRPDFEHMTMMNDPEVRAALLRLISPAQALVDTAGPAPASIGDYEEIRGQVERIAFSREMVPAVATIRQLFDNLPPDRQQALALRWFIELPKSNPALGGR